MENTNKPQWLIDAENAINEFENSKYGKMNTKEFNISQRSKIHGGVVKYVKNNPEHQKKAFAKMLEKNPNHQSEAGKKGGAKGGKAAHKSMLEKYGEDGLKQIRKEQFKNSNLNKEEFHKKGAAASHANKRKALELLWNEILNELPETFTKPEVADIMIKYGKHPGYLADMLHHIPEKFELIEKGKKGWTHSRYKKV